MAITYIDGFDLYADAPSMSRRGWTLGSASYAAMATGRFTGKALSLSNSNTSVMTQAIAVPTDTVAVGFAFKTDNIGGYNANGGEIFRFLNTGSTIIRVGVTTSGHIRVGRGDFTSNLIVGSASGVIASATWYYIELEITRHASAGAVTIYVNGTSVATVSSVNTGASNLDSFGMNGGFSTVYYDDFYLTNSATRLGECQIETLAPSADTATKDFTRSTGSNNYANVDEQPTTDDTDYNSSATVGHKDLFDLANLSSTPSTVKAVQPILVARKDNSGTREIRTNMKNGSTTTNGTTRTLGSTYLFYTDLYLVNPDDSAAFDGTDINAMQIGYEIVT